jgi:hypothetical protein
MTITTLTSRQFSEGTGKLARTDCEALAATA